MGIEWDKRVEYERQGRAGMVPAWERLPSMLELKGICKRYVTQLFTQVPLDSVSLSFRDNEFVAFISPWRFLVDLSVLASLEVPCRELLEFGVAYVVEDAAVDDLCAWSTCSKGRRCPAHSAPARGGK